MLLKETGIAIDPQQQKDDDEDVESREDDFLALSLARQEEAEGRWEQDQ